LNFAAFEVNPFIAVYHLLIMPVVFKTRHVLFSRYFYDALP